MFSKRGLNLLVFDTKEYAPPTSKIDLVTKDGINNIMLVVNPHCSPCITKLRRTLTIINRKRYTSLSIVFLIDEDDTDSINLAKYLIIKSLQDDAFRVFKEYVDSYPEKMNDDIKKLVIYIDEKTKAQNIDKNWKPFSIGVFLMTVKELKTHENEKYSLDLISKHFNQDVLDLKLCNVAKKIVCVIYDGSKLIYDTLYNMLNK